MLRRLSDEMDLTEDWRDGVGCQKEVMGHIYTQELFFNSVLMVGEESTPLKVIKEIVQSLSIVLERRLCSSNERDPQELPIFHFNDIPVDSMTQLIKFAYTHEWDWSWSGEVGSLTSLLTLNKVADELKVQKLIPKIKTTIDHLITNEESFLNPENACHIFQEAISAGIENLRNATLKFILREANLVFSKVEYYKMLNGSNFIKILKEDELEVESGLELFHIALKWGKSKCAELRQNENENFKEILKEILPVIRFTLNKVTELKVKKSIPKIKTTIDHLITNEESCLNPQNACHIFQEAISAGIENLRNATLKFILREANLVFSKVENYKMLSELNFIEILKEDELEVESELELFHIASKWGKAKCAELRQNENENFKEILKEILPVIRFTRMTPKEFVEQVQPMELFGTNEIIQILTKFALAATGLSASGLENSRKYRPANLPSVIHKVGQFNKNKSTKLIQAVHQSPHDFQIQVDSVPNAVDLMTFLQSTSSTPSRLNLTVDTILDKNLPTVEFPNLKFPQLTSLNFVSLDTKTQLECLIRIVTNSPNLHQLSIGPFEWHPPYPWESSSNVIKFLDSVSLKNVEFSCGLICNEGFNVDLLRKLKRNGVSINKLRFDGRPSNRSVGILEYLNQDLQEIHQLIFTKFPLKCSFINLKFLSVECTPQVLLNILRSCPNLQQLKWIADTSTSTNNEYLYLPHLTSLTLRFWNVDGLKFAIENLRNCWNCPNLNELTIITQVEGGWSEVYKTFPHIKTLRLVSGRGLSLENLTGVKKESLKQKHGDPSFHPRPPYIGHLKELSSLSFGYRHYQHPGFISEWNLDLSGWTDGICHLPKLTHLQLPPITRTQAKSILNVLSSHSKQLKSVEFQVWFGQQEGQNGTMTRGQVDQLSISYNKQFKVEGIRVLPYNNDRNYLF